MSVYKVLSQISLCSPHISLCSLHMLIRDNTFRFNLIFFKKRILLNKYSMKVSSQISLCRLHTLIWYDSLRTFIKPHFSRARFTYFLDAIFQRSVSLEVNMLQFFYSYVQRSSPGHLSDSWSALSTLLRDSLQVNLNAPGQFLLLM